MPNTNLSAVEQACRELGLDQKGLASVIGVSTRTIQRNRHNRGVRYPHEYERLIRFVHPHNPDLAARLATESGTNLAALGFTAPAPPVRPPPPPPRAGREHAEAVVSAAADALSLVPRDARPIVAAIFARVSELEVDLPGLVKLLKADVAAPPKPAAAKK